MFAFCQLFFTFCFAEAADTEDNFNQGAQYFEAGNFELAIPLLEKTVLAEPKNAEYHHLLAKSYGRHAEQVNWLKAVRYAKKTRQHLEIAVELAPENTAILDDMMDYYQEAPAFLGGNKKKAKAIKDLIEKINQRQEQDLYSYSQD